MTDFLNPHNGTSLTVLIDVTAHSISLFQENELPTNINEICMLQANMSIAEAIGVQIDELGNTIIQMYQPIGVISGEQMPGLERTLNYMNYNLFGKGEPAVNEHRYHITKRKTI